jgi:hypothetical protein
MTIIKNSYWDSDGLLHVHPGEPSENGILFSSEYWMLRLLLEKKVSCEEKWYDECEDHRALLSESKDRIERAIGATEKYDEKNKLFFDPLPTDKNPSDGHFSHDNMTGLHVMRLLVDARTKQLPTAYWNKRMWWHPRDWAFYAMAQAKPFSFLLFPLVALAALTSAFRKREITSGKMLLWLRLNALQLNKSFIVSRLARLTFNICERIMRKAHGKVPWLDISSIYFKEETHPVRLLMGDIYDK